MFESRLNSTDNYLNVVVKFIIKMRFSIILYLNTITPFCQKSALLTNLKLWIGNIMFLVDINWTSCCLDMILDIAVRS